MNRWRDSKITNRKRSVVDDSNDIVKHFDR